MTSSTPRHTDVVVVGGGPAGSAAALAAARHGMRVTLVDRARFPRDKVCGSCLSPLGVDALRRLDAMGTLAGAVELDTVEVRCATRALRLRRASGVAIARTELDARLLAEAARRGVEVMTGVSARVDTTGHAASSGARVMLGGEAASAQRVLEPRVTIVADGLGGSALDGHPSFSWRESPRSHIGLGAIVPGDCLAIAPREVHLSVADDGYIGLVRLPDGRVDVAAAVAPGAVRAAGGPAACASRWLLEAYGTSIDHAQRVHLAEVLAAARWRGTPRLTRRRASVAAHGILLAGDATGYVEPFTGEGMGWALAGGAAAGELAARIVCGKADERAWAPALRRTVHAARLRCRALALVLRSPRLVERMLWLGGMVPAPFERFAAGIGRPAEAGT